jgi:hypothetical protein
MSSSRHAWQTSSLRRRPPASPAFSPSAPRSPVPRTAFATQSNMRASLRRQASIPITPTKPRRAIGRPSKRSRPSRAS